MKWGIIDVAIAAGAQIIPTVVDYDRSSMASFVSFGMPMAPDENTDHAEAIRDLRDSMATLRWQLWEKQQPLKRYDRDALRADIYAALTEYPPIDWDSEQEIIYRPYPSPEEVFSSIDSLTPRKENAFLFSKHSPL